MVVVIIESGIELEYLRIQTSLHRSLNKTVNSSRYETSVNPSSE